MRKTVFTLLVLAFSSHNLLAYEQVKEIPEQEEKKIVTLGALDKISARLKSIEIKYGENTRFGSLEIQVKKCKKNPPEDTPEVTAFLIIDDHQTDGKVINVFRGWMFASSPALSSLEHGVYDIWVTDCKSLPIAKSVGIK